MMTYHKYVKLRDNFHDNNSANSADKTKGCFFKTVQINKLVLSSFKQR